MSLARRDFLKLTGLGGLVSLSPVEQFLNLVTHDLIRSSVAEAAGNTESRNYLNIFMPGGPSRWIFDQWLRTSESDPKLFFNLMTATSFKNPSGFELEHRTINYKGYQVPYLFSQSVNLSSGRALISELLDHMMVIRGFGTGFDGHSFNALAQMAPLGGAATISALSADESVKTFEAVQWPDRAGNSTFNSLQGKALNKIPGSTPLNTLLEGFAGAPTGLQKARNLKERRAEAFALANAKLKSFAESEGPGAKVMAQNLENARALMKKGVGNISDYWLSATTRYKKIIDDAVQTLNILGISDREIIRANDTEESTRNLNGYSYYGIQLPEGDRILAKDFDLRRMLTKAHLSILSESLAMAEYCFSESLVTSLEVIASDLSNLIVKLDNESTEKTSVHILDMHSTGCVPNLLLMNAYYRGLCAGLLELIRNLKNKVIGGKNLWAQTVIHIHGDFARSARSNGSGSDHGFNQIATSVFSGALTAGPYVVGHIKQGVDMSTGYNGTQGLGAKIKDYVQLGIPNTQVAASTITELLGVSHNPFKNVAWPLAQFENGIWTVKYPGKIIEGV